MWWAQAWGNGMPEEMWGFGIGGKACRYVSPGAAIVICTLMNIAR